MNDGSSAYLGMINQALLSSYYYLLENLDYAGFSWENDSNGQPINVKIGWIDANKQVVPRSQFTDRNSQVPLPIIVLEDSGGTKVPFELGNQLSARSRTYIVSVFAESILDRNRLVDFLENIFSEREITIRDYNSGSPANFEGSSSLPICGYGNTSATYSTPHTNPTDPNILDRYIGVISFTLEILQAA